MTERTSSPNTSTVRPAERDRTNGRTRRKKQRPTKANGESGAGSARSLRSRQAVVLAPAVFKKGSSSAKATVRTAFAKVPSETAKLTGKGYKFLWLFVDQKLWQAFEWAARNSASYAPSANANAAASLIAELLSVTAETKGAALVDMEARDEHQKFLAGVRVGIQMVLDQILPLKTDEKLRALVADVIKAVRPLLQVFGQPVDVTRAVRFMSNLLEFAAAWGAWEKGEPGGDSFQELAQQMSLLQSRASASGR
jgi:hypothetical protein